MKSVRRAREYVPDEVELEDVVEVYPDDREIDVDMIDDQEDEDEDEDGMEVMDADEDDIYTAVEIAYFYGTDVATYNPSEIRAVTKRYVLREPLKCELLGRERIDEQDFVPIIRCSWLDLEVCEESRTAAECIFEYRFGQLYEWYTDPGLDVSALSVAEQYIRLRMLMLVERVEHVEPIWKAGLVN